MRTFSPAITAQIAAKTAIPRRLFRLHLDGGLLCYTDHTSDIVFQDVTYNARRISHSPINTYMGRQADSCSVKIDDVDGQLTGYDEYEDFEGRRLDIWQVFLSEQLGVIDGQAVTPSFSRASDAYDPEDGSSHANNILRYVTGADGTAEGAGLFEEGTSNWVSNARMQTTTSWAASNSGALAVESNAASVGGSFPRDNTACLKGTIAAGQVSCHIVQTKTLALATAHTSQFWVYVPGSVPAGKAVISAWYDNAGWVAIASAGITERDQWVLKTLTFTTNATYSTHIIGVGLSGTTPGLYSYACLAQLEQKSYATSWQDPSITRAAEYMTADAGILDPAEGMVSLFLIRKGTPGTYARIWEWGDYSNPITKDHLDVAWGSGDGLNKIVLYYAVASGVSISTTVTLPADVAVDVPYRIIARWKVGEKLKLFVNDGTNTYSAESSGNLATAGTFALYPTLNIGGSGSTSEIPNSALDDFHTLSRAYTDAEVTAMIALGAPSQETPDTTALIRFNNALTTDDKIVQFSGKMDLPTD